MTDHLRQENDERTRVHRPEQAAGRVADRADNTSSEATAAYPTSLVGERSFRSQVNAPMRASMMLNAQRTHGNAATFRAVQRSMQRSGGVSQPAVQRSATGQVAVQREEDEQNFQSVSGAIEAATAGWADGGNNSDSDNNPIGSAMGSLIGGASSVASEVGSALGFTGGGSQASNGAGEGSTDYEGSKMPPVPDWAGGSGWERQGDVRRGDAPGEWNPINADGRSQGEHRSYQEVIASANEALDRAQRQQNEDALGRWGGPGGFTR